MEPEEKGDNPGADTPPSNEIVDENQEPASSDGQVETSDKGQGAETMADAIEDALKTLDPNAEEDDGTAVTPPKKEDESVDASGTEPAKPKDGDEAPSSGAKTSDELTEAELEADPTDDELKAYPPKHRKRVAQLLSQRNSARRDVEAYKADAEGYREIQNFVRTNRLSADEVQRMFDVSALAKSGSPQDAEAALEKLEPLVEQLMRATGRVLPDDLRNDVDTGALTEERAAEIGRMRSAQEAQDRQARLTSEDAQRQADQAARDATAESIRQAVGTWTTEQGKSDPDFEKKRPFLRSAALEVLQEKGPAKTPEQAIEYAKLAYSRVTERLVASLPGKKATRPAPATGTHGNRSDASPAPTSLAEAIRQSLGDNASGM